MDFKVCLLFVVDAKGGTASVAVTQTCLLSSAPFSVSDRELPKRETKNGCMVCVQNTEAETPLKLFTVHNFRMCLLKPFFLTL